MMNRQAYILTCCVVALVAAGCASSPASHYYMLSPASPQAFMPQANCSVSVGPISVPAVLDRRQIVVRTGPNQVFFDEFNRWSSPLKDDIGRVVVENLVSLLATTQVTLFPQSTAAEASYRVMIDVLRFDSEPGRAATLDALWTVSSTKGTQAYRGRTTLTEATQGNDYAALVAAHSRTLGKLSAEIAGKIREMEAQKS